jgi:hypothetical protein
MRFANSPANGYPRVPRDDRPSIVLLWIWCVQQPANKRTPTCSHRRLTLISVSHVLGSVGELRRDIGCRWAWSYRFERAMSPPPCSLNSFDHDFFLLSYPYTIPDLLG